MMPLADGCLNGFPQDRESASSGGVGDKYEETIFDMKPPCDGFIDSRAGSDFRPMHRKT